MPPILLGYLALAVAITWPAALGGRVPGAERTDLYNSLWSLWFVQDAVGSGAAPYLTPLLDHPDGGALVVSDVLAGAWGLLLVPLLGPAGAYAVLVVGRLAASGAVAHGLAADWLGERAGPWAPIVAGVAYESAPVLLSGVHNGTSEAFTGAWAALAAWAALRVARHGGWRRVALAGVALLLAALASWYSAVTAFLFAAGFLVTGGRGTRLARAGALLLGLALVAPWAVAFHAAATGPDNVVGIKNPRELAGVRRTTGAADPRGWLAPGDFRSPDFRRMSRYGEAFIHCHYLGWGLLLLGVLGAIRRPREALPLLLAGGGGLVLAMGPVVVLDGAPLIVMADRAVPMPYILVERLPGFRSLSLLWRLGQAPALALAMLASAAVAGRARWVAAVASVVVLAESRLLSPVGWPGTAPAAFDPAIEALADAPAGAVLNFPVVGGRPYLYEQTRHEHPVAGTLNFPNNPAGRRTWKAMLDAADLPAEERRARVSAAARKTGVRYLVVHVDPMARPDMHDDAVRAVRDAFPPLPVAGRDAGPGAPVQVYPLW